jgi:hypothetical protein
MQPYFFPYAGYFRLFAEADTFVIYDCVQFPRRGFVHRNRLGLANGSTAWLTLPLAPCDRKTAIRDLKFQVNARDKFAQRMLRFPSVSDIGSDAGAIGLPDDILSALFDFECDPVEYLERTLVATATSIGMKPEIFRSSTLDLSDGLTGEDRVLRIVQNAGGERYLNAPGGRALYSEEKFRKAGVELAFLHPFEGPTASVLEILCSKGISGLRDIVLDVW